jgi:cytochrome c oxidase subunit 4
MSAISRRQTALTWGGLIALTATSFGLSYAHLGALGIPVALGIALIKASLVVLVFMELLVEPFTVRVTLVTAFALVVLLVFFVVADVVTRAPALLLPTGR